MLKTAVSPVVQTCMLACTGALLSRSGKLKHPEGTEALAVACFYMFIPALAFSKLASSVTIQKLGELWPLLANMTFNVLSGLIIGMLAASCLRILPENRNVVIAAVAFKNVGNLPLVFIGSLCSLDTDNMFTETLGKQCFSVAVAYVAVDICAATILQFTIAIQLLRKRPSALDLIVEEKDEELDGLLSMDAALSSDVLWVERRTDGEGISGSRGASGEIEMQRSGLEVGFQEPKINDIEEEKVGVRFWHQLKAWVLSVDWKSMLPLPTQAAILGVLVGCIGPIRDLLYSDDAPLKPVSQALDLLGQGLIPSAIPLLGAVLSKGPGQSSITRAQVAGIVVITLLLQPWILTGIVIFAIKLGVFHIPDPMFLLILLLSNATPSAINLQTLTVLFNNGAEEMAQILFWQYVFSLLSLPLNVWAFLSIIPLITK